jgi:lipopolysaccharide biosynthesis regulator YciM
MENFAIINGEAMTYQLIIDKDNSLPVVQSALMTCYVKQEDQKKVLEYMTRKYNVKNVLFWKKSEKN